jgi:hypothetical protein
MRTELLRKNFGQNIDVMEVICIESSLLKTYWSKFTSSSRWFGGPTFAPWEFEFPFPGCLISTLLGGHISCVNIICIVVNHCTPIIYHTASYISYQLPNETGQARWPLSMPLTLQPKQLNRRWPFGFDPYRFFSRSVPTTFSFSRDRVLYWQSTGPNPLNHGHDLSTPALRHGSLNSLSKPCARNPPGGDVLHFDACQGRWAQRPRPIHPLRGELKPRTPHSRWFTIILHAPTDAVWTVKGGRPARWTLHLSERELFFKRTPKN